RQALLGRNREMAVVLERFLGRLKPFLELCFAHHVGDERLLDLLLRSLASKTREDRTNQRDWIALGLLLDCCEIGNFPCGNVLSRNRQERLGCVLQLHRMSFLVLEVDGYLVEQEVDAGDLAEAPALVLDERAGRKLCERFASGGCELSG